GYDLVRSRWRGLLLSGPFEDAWREVLHDGFVPDSGYATATTPAQAVPLPTLTPDQEGLEVVFRLDPTVLDGRFTNNGWCLEQPDPVTKIVWDNVALMSPETAQELEVVNEYDEGIYEVDMVELAVNGQTLRLPAWIVPGHP